MSFPPRSFENLTLRSHMHHILRQLYPNCPGCSRWPEHLGPCLVTTSGCRSIYRLEFLVPERRSGDTTPTQAPESNMNKGVTEWSPALVTEAQQNIPENDLDSCLSALLFCLQTTDLLRVVDTAIIENMFSLLVFDYAETVARVRTVSDAQKLIDLIDLLINDESFLSHCGQDVASKAARLASEIFSRTPLLPQSLFLNKPGHYIQEPILHLSEMKCQSVFISRILDHNYIVPALGIYDLTDSLLLAGGNDKSVTRWLRSSPNLVTRIRVILEIARTIRYIHSMDVALFSGCIDSKHFFLNSNLHAKFGFIGLFAWWVRAVSIYGDQYAILTDYTYESNISAFACLFREVCFKGPYKNLSNRLVEGAMQLIERCRAVDPRSQPTMKDVVTEMETWNLT